MEEGVNRGHFLFIYFFLFTNVNKLIKKKVLVDLELYEGYVGYEGYEGQVDVNVTTSTVTSTCPSYPSYPTYPLSNSKFPNPFFFKLHMSVTPQIKKTRFVIFFFK